MTIAVLRGYGGDSKYFLAQPTTLSQPGIQTENTTVSKKHKRLWWWGRVISGTNEMMKYDPKMLV